MQKFFHFAHLKPTFSILHIHFYKTFTSVYLFYTFIQKNIHSFTFFIIFSLMASLSLSLSLSLSQTNHRHHHPATIKSKPRSVYLPCAFFVSYSHGWLEPKPRWSQNPNKAKTQTHSTQNPRLIGTKVAKVD